MHPLSKKAIASSLFLIAGVSAWVLLSDTQESLSHFLPASDADGTSPSQQSPQPKLSHADPSSLPAPTIGEMQTLPEIYHRTHFKYDPPCTKVAGTGCMVHVPGATFWMGAQSDAPHAPHYDPSAAKDESPPHQITLEPYWIHKEEVKVIQYGVCIQQKACSLKGVVTRRGYFNWGRGNRKEHPMNGVSWEAANEYCTWIGGRLPTEAQWEYVARGKDDRRYPWGDAPPDCKNTKLSDPECGIDGTSARPSDKGVGPLLVEDLAGSLWEWTADWYGETTYSKSTNKQHLSPETGVRRVIRGGGWMDKDPADLRVTGRAALPPEAQMSDLGFRCVRPAEPLR